MCVRLVLVLFVLDPLMSNCLMKILRKSLSSLLYRGMAILLIQVGHPLLESDWVRGDLLRAYPVSGGPLHRAV